jgi:hypothetical protein
MGYARHIGRVGALAVTLGVGAAIANAPGIAYAETPGTSPDGDAQTKTTTSTTDTSSSTNQSSTQQVAGSADADDTESSTTGQKAQRRSVLRSVVGAIRDIADDAVAAGNAAGATGRLDNQESAGGDSADRKTSISSTSTTSTTSSRARTTTFDDASEKLESTVTTFTQRVEQAVQKYTAPAPESTPSPSLKTASQTLTTAATPLLQTDPRPRTSVVPLFTDPLGALLKPFVYGGTEPPLQLPTLMAIVAAVRDEVERILLPRQTQVAYPLGQSQTYPNPPADPTKQHVLVIAIDGTNMSKVLEDPVTNDKFVALMDTSTTSAPSIVGHTTVSNPSWTAVLTGAWNEKTGVINNVYTPTTYDRWPTVFTQLEQKYPNIRTKAIADWDVIGAIAASGEGADEVVYIAQKPDDPTWEKTDEAVVAETVKTLAVADVNGDPYKGEAPNFMVTYLVQVDENGHMYGGDSLEYEEAIARTDENLGTIMQAVADREKATCAGGSAACEDWTVIVVTDHGHQPQPGFGHGFQSPRETETFVIVDGPQFGDSKFNPDYEIVDVTPTVLSLFGVPQGSRLDGVPLQSLHGSDSRELTQTELQNILKAQIASNDYPNIIVNVALTTRTIVAFVPYFVHGADLPAPLGDILYVATNVPAQVVAFATGVYGARLFPILPPPPAITFIPDGPTSIDAFLRMDCGGGSLAPARCIAV